MEEMDNIIIMYESASKPEVSKRQISSVMSKVSNGKIFISAYCHLRDSVRSFSLSNILEVWVNGVIVDKNEFYYENIRDKKQFLKDLEKSYILRQDEFNKFVEIYTSLKKTVEALLP
jgi:predicted DNA-binding transcriptional regulator YafY